MNVVRFDDVHKSYSDTQAVGGLSFAVKKGECLAILGPSGCGKTTTLRLIAGFEEPNKGELFIGEKLVSSRRSPVAPWERRVGMVFQDLALWPHLSVAQNIAFGLKTPKNSKAAVANKVTQMLDLVHLDPALRIATRTSSPAVKSNGWLWPGPLCPRAAAALAG